MGGLNPGRPGVYASCDVGSSLESRCDSSQCLNISPTTEDCVYIRRTYHLSLQFFDAQEKELEKERQMVVTSNHEKSSIQLITQEAKVNGGPNCFIMFYNGS
jgi:hypothetical protein